MKKIIFILSLTILVSCSYTNSSKISLDLIPYGHGEKMGYFNADGKIIINPQFASASMFRDGLALVKTDSDNEKWGYIDEEGKFVINANYKEATVFNEGLAFVVNENGAPTAINKKGEIQFVLQNAEEVWIYSEGLAAYSIREKNKIKWGFINKKGETVINPQFENSLIFFEDKCAVQNEEGKWGYINKEGKIIINYQFDEAYSFKKGYASVKLDDKMGVIDTEGKYVINPQFNEVYSDGDVFMVNQDGKIGWCNKDTKFTINPQFERAFCFHNNELAAYENDGKYGYIDKEGKIEINPQFDFASNFVKNRAIVKAGDKYGIINKEGKYEVNPQFEFIPNDFLTALLENEPRYSRFNSVRTDYFNINKITNSINFNKPEGLSFEDDFRTISKKLNKTIDDFEPYSSKNLIFENKELSNDAEYSFTIMGDAKEYENYDLVLSTKHPQGFAYTFNLKNNGSSKANNIYKALLSKLSNYEIVKEGTIKDKDVIILKDKVQKIVIVVDNSSKLEVFILESDFNLNGYMSRITSNED